MACPLSKAIISANGWDEFPEWLKSGHPVGEISGATSAELIPAEAELKRHAIDLTVSKVYAFEIITLEIEGKRDKGKRHELRYKVDFPDPKGARKLEEYRHTINDGKSVFRVSYVEQAKLDMEPPAGEQIELDDTRRKATAKESD
jgi:hypothetical protein